METVIKPEGLVTDGESAVRDCVFVSVVPLFLVFVTTVEPVTDVEGVIVVVSETEEVWTSVTLVDSDADNDFVIVSDF